MPIRVRRQALRLFTVVVEDERTGAVDRVLLYAAGSMTEAEGLARAFYRVDDASPGRRFAAQPITEVSGPGGVVYGIVLRRHPGGRR